MAIANMLSADSENVVRIHDVNFNDTLNYEVRLTNSFGCDVITVDIDDIFYCNEEAKLKFSLPCISSGEYKMQIINKADNSTIYEYPAKVF